MKNEEIIQCYMQFKKNKNRIKNYEKYEFKQEHAMRLSYTISCAKKPVDSGKAIS